MHLWWPSLRLRESFKDSYLRNIGFNLNLMRSSQATAKNNNNTDSSSSSSSSTTPAAHDQQQQQHAPLLQKSDPYKGKLVSCLSICSDLLFLFSCCCCCFCCGELNLAFFK